MASAYLWLNSQLPPQRGLLDVPSGAQWLWAPGVGDGDSIIPLAGLSPSVGGVLSPFCPLVSVSPTKES